VFANRTLNLRSVAAIGYDMDYTLIHYRTDEWETAAFEHARALLGAQGWPVDDLAFTPDDHLQGLVLDLDLGNLVKATRFGYVIQAHHGTTRLSYDQVRTTYAGTFVELSEPRWQFLNTMFSLSEASMYAQLVDRLDSGLTPGVMGYDDLYDVVRHAIDESHARGALKAGIVADPDRFVELDPDVAETLADQRAAGKRLLLVTNSDWAYTRAMMSWCFDRAVPSGSWRDLFDVVVVAAAKPRFFSEDGPAFLVVDEEAGLLAPHRGPYEVGAVYHGGSARLMETSLGLTGNQILYVGDHLFGDVHMSKATLRWRTALILRELEDELADAAAFADDERTLQALMANKAELEDELALLRLARVRGEAPDGAGAEVDQRVAELRKLDERIAPLAQRASQLGNRVWGPLMRAGNDKSIFARQVERHADIYTSRVSNLGLRTPFAYLRAARTSLPHDPT
jgi:HAD superfamily 5'-nucleotidase-like hydrolase